VEDTTNCLLELSCLGLSYAPFKIGIFLDDICKHSQCVALPKVIVKVASCLNKSHDILLLDDLPESDLILTKLSEYSMCVQGGLKVLAVL
jgi:hypothetical protein